VSADISRYESLDSTNEEAKRLVAKGEKGPLWILAARQSAGKGRRGNSWVSQDGNLFASLLAPAEDAMRLSAPYAFAAGLAVADTVSGYTESKITLKWPNDVLLEGQKLAGILLETVPGALIVGIGVNLAVAPEGTPFPATSLAQHAEQAPVSEDVLARLALYMETWIALWKERGFAPLRDAWLARAAQLGEPIRARLPDGEREGIFEDLDSEGALLLRTKNGLVRVTSGEVFF
jgi:BirA family biotin operon repressor/biotin-[acetyl-CoA-carboxylase] ligase